MGNIVKMGVTVEWGLIPGQVIGRRNWYFTYDQVQSVEDLSKALEEPLLVLNKMTNPQIWNWTRMDWVWF